MMTSAANMTTISHAHYSNRPAFAAAMQKAFGGKVAILPNAEVMSACLEQGCTRRGNLDVEIAVIADDQLRTAYRVGGEFGTLLVIDANDNETATYDLGASDEDSEAEVAEVLSSFAK